MKEESSYPLIPPSRPILPSVDVKRIWQNGWAVLRARYYLRQATSVGPKVRLWGRPSIHNAGRIIIGDRARLVSTIATLELVAGRDGTVEIGEGAFINYGCSIAASQLVRIGPHCSIGTYVIMMDNDFHRLEPERRNERPESLPIILEENVWLGARVIVLRGVTIGAGSAIGAGSVVTRDIPPRSLAVGVPAKVIRTL
jgi:maltose O-acetyltransferase